jgi:tripartite-type tricarboxylate transporter receptor subunit TctC
LSYVQPGRLRALATTGTQRTESLPGVPTVAESGFRSFEVVAWNGFFVPTGKPPALIDRLSSAVRDAVRDPDVRRRLLAMGIEPVGNSPAEFGAFLRSQITRWAALVQGKGIKVD